MAHSFQDRLLTREVLVLVAKEGASLPHGHGADGVPVG